MTLLAGGRCGFAVADTGTAGAATRPSVLAVGPDEVAGPLADHKDIVWCVAFSPDGRFFVSGGGGEVRQSRPGDFLNVTWAPGRDFALRVWDARTGTLVRRLPGHGALVACVAWSPDGKSLLSGSEDGTLRLWDAATGKELRRFEGHAGMVAAAVFAADGTRVLSGSRDETVRLWDVKTGRELSALRGPAAGFGTSRCPATAPVPRPVVTRTSRPSGTRRAAGSFAGWPGTPGPSSA